MMKHSRKDYVFFASLSGVLGIIALYLLVSVNDMSVVWNYIMPDRQVASVTTAIVTVSEEVQNSAPAEAPVRSEPTPVTVKVIFTEPLTYGSTGEQVVLLQKLLSKYDHIYPEKEITGSYGSLTQRAVKLFQIEYEIADETSDQFGVVGPATRAKLNELAAQFGDF